jgi:hypothetical protein
MKVEFLYMGSRGTAEYNSSEDTYSWSYEGTEDKIIEPLSMLDSRRAFLEMNSTGEPIEDEDVVEESVALESYEKKEWDEQIKDLADLLSSNGADIHYVGE